MLIPPFLQAALSIFPAIGAVHLAIHAFFVRKFFWGVLSLAFLAATVFVFQPLFNLLPYLGPDSFREGFNFDLREAIFYVSTFGIGRLGAAPLITGLVIYAGLILTLGGCYLLLSKQYPKCSVSHFNLAVSAFLVVPILGYSSAKAWEGYQVANEHFDDAVKNFRPENYSLLVDAEAQNELKIFLYIGESTSRLNWSLYGYPRETTAALENLPNQQNLLVFQNVSSTHSHTSPALLEALSLSANSSDTANNLQSIYQRERISLIEVLRRAGAPTTLFSNQGSSGSWNLGANLIFAAASRRAGATDRMLGNADYRSDDRNFDHQLLRTIWRDQGSWSTSRLVAFHSYAGHGSYAAFVPPGYRIPVDNYFQTVSSEAIFGASLAPTSLTAVESYDSAMTYIAENLAHTINKLEESDNPLVLIYFSDHGESVFTGRGHDSARYVWEMTAVPFLIYFNDAARRAFPDKYEKYRGRAESRKQDSLANLPSLVLDLLGITVRYPGGDIHEASECGFGTGECAPQFHMVRELLDGRTSYVRTVARALETSSLFVDETDRTSALQAFANEFESRGSDTEVCIHRSNTLARIIRARAISSCLELDVVVDNDEIFVYHPPAENVGLTLATALHALGGQESTIWLDAKNISDSENCDAVSNFVEQNSNYGKRYFIEFPSETVVRLELLRFCSNKLRSAGARTSYYIPTELGLSCALTRAGDSCVRLEEILSKVADSGVFSDISFDYRVLPAITEIGVAGVFSWNTWHVEDQNVSRLADDRFNIIMPYADRLNFN